MEGQTVIAVTSLTTARGIERQDITEAGPGEIVWVAGIPEVTIGDTITEPADPRPLPRLQVDEPTLHMTFGVNTSPLSGREGKYLTSRQIKARLDRETLGNVSIEVLPTASPETFEVRGRGELQLAVLIEQMRREGYELQVSRPEVLLHEVDGQVQEPYERITVDIPPDQFLVVTPSSDAAVKTSVGHAFFKKSAPAQQMEQVMIVVSAPMPMPQAQQQARAGK